MAELYRPDIITLSAEKPDFDYDNRIFEAAAKWIYERGGFTPDMLKEEPARRVLGETFRILNTAIEASISEEVPVEFTGALENNAFIFSGLKTYHSLSEVGLKLTDERGAVKPFHVFAEEIEGVNGTYNRNYLWAEYNHAVSSSQMAVKWRDFEGDGDRYDLQYRTAGDDKVRPDHAALNGVTLPPDDPFWSRYLPPNDWNCRCNVVQVRRNKYERSDSAKAVELGDAMTSEPKKQIFRFNAGKELKVFPDKHPYHKAPKEAKKVVEELARERFSARTIEQAEQQFRERLGVNCDLSGFKKKDIGQVKDIFDCVDKHFRDFPELREKIKFVGSMSGRVKMLTEAKYEELKKVYAGRFYSDSGLMDSAKKWARKTAYLSDCYAYSSEGCKQYNLNGLVFNTAWAGDKVIASLQRDVAGKFHPEGCATVKALFDHELGHKLDALFDLYRNADFLKIYNEAVGHGAQYVRENLAGYAYCPSLFTSANYTPQKEFIAEAWSEYLNNPSPRPLAEAVGKLIENVYRNKKDRD